MSSSPSFLDPVLLPLLKGKEILDVASGFGRWGCLMATNYFEWGLDNPPQVDAIDGCLDNVKRCQNLGVYRNVTHGMLPLDLGIKKYDTVLASEIIEHLPESSVDEFFCQIEKVARQRVIISTPNWPNFRQGHSENSLEAHLCYVSQKALRKRHYQILGAGFGNPRSIPCKIIWRLHKISGNRIINFEKFESLSRIFPDMAHTTVAFKDLPA